MRGTSGKSFGAAKLFSSELPELKAKVSFKEANFSSDIRDHAAVISSLSDRWGGRGTSAEITAGVATKQN